MVYRCDQTVDLEECIEAVKRREDKRNGDSPRPKDPDELTDAGFYAKFGYHRPDANS